MSRARNGCGAPMVMAARLWLWRPADGSSEDGEVLHEAVDVGLVVLDRDQPLLDLAPGREEDPAVVLIEPVRVAVPVVNAEETAVAGDGFGAEYDAAFGAGSDDV